MTILLSTSYFGPIQYYSKLVSAQKILLERYEHYPKQTYRNRCIIYGANGPQTLSVPVTKDNEIKVYTRDIRIDNSSNWQKIHLRSLESAYRCSPFYQYYFDDIIPFFERKFTHLYDLNFEIMQCMSALLQVTFPIEETDHYVASGIEGADFRDSIHPKQRMYKYDVSFKPPVYWQVFETKYGFISNLSILDLLFNTGPEALQHLKTCAIQIKQGRPFGTA